MEGRGWRLLGKSVVFIVFMVFAVPILMLMSLAAPEQAGNFLLQLSWLAVDLKSELNAMQIEVDRQREAVKEQREQRRKQRRKGA